MIIQNCKIHGLTSHGEWSQGPDKPARIRCVKCSSSAVKRSRHRLKELLVQEAGGRCQRCGYSKCMRALQFHHRIPDSKLFNLNGRSLHLAIDRLRIEAAKCDLLCANCHAEVEDELLYR